MKKARRPSVASEIYDLLDEFVGKKFTSRDVHNRMPWVSVKHISASLVSLEQRGVVIREKGSYPVKWEVAPVSDPPRFVNSTQGYKMAGRRGGGKTSPPDAPRPELFSDKIQALSDKLLELAMDIEQLKLEHASDVEIAREYHRRKKRTK